MKPLFQEFDAGWGDLQSVNSRSFTCGYCGLNVSSDKGYPLQTTDFAGSKAFEKQVGGIYICPNCDSPNFIDPSNNQFPAPSMGEPVPNVPHKIDELYEEARICTSVNCYTAATMVARKLLIHIAVNKGAKEGKSFKSYVDFLDDEGYIPKSGKDWVDTIRTLGNDANHEISKVSQEDTKQLLTFVFFLLSNIYDLPSRAQEYQSSSD